MCLKKKKKSMSTSAKSPTSTWVGQRCILWYWTNEFIIVPMNRGTYSTFRYHRQHFSTKIELIINYSWSWYYSCPLHIRTRIIICLIDTQCGSFFKKWNEDWTFCAAISEIACSSFFHTCQKKGVPMNHLLGSKKSPKQRILLDTST